MFDRTTRIDEFLDAAAAKRPAPGGGSVTALAGALAASMGEMVVNYSVGKRGLEAHQDDLKAALAELHRSRQVLLQLMVEDQSGYEALTAAKKLPEGPEREQRLPAALMESIRAPQSMAATAVAILELCDRLVDKVNFYLLSDLAVCADLAMTTARCAVYNVRVNLPDLADPAERQATERATNQLLARATELIRRVGPNVWARHARGK